MKILAGAVVRQDPEILAAHLKTMKWQETEHDIDLLYINDLDPDEPGYREALDMLAEDPDIRLINSDIGERPPGADYVVGEDTHIWQIPTFEYLAKLKQKILDIAVEEGYDAVWLVDTDLLCDPGTVQSLADCTVPVAFGVFWTAWHQDQPPLPQVWTVHPYGYTDGRLTETEFFEHLHDRDMINVLGGGACSLIRTETLSKLHYWPFIPGLPRDGMWQGEDRHFCIRANMGHIPLTADAWPDIAHIYRPSYKKDIPEILDRLQDIYLPAANIGDFVSFTLEDLESADLAGRMLHVRGRLGQLKLLPELEYDLQDLAPGQEVLTNLHFPLHYPIVEYRGLSRLFRLKLLAVKRYIPHIGLPRVASDFDNRYYTPAQIAAMRRTRVHDHSNTSRTDTD